MKGFDKTVRLKSVENLNIDPEVKAKVQLIRVISGKSRITTAIPGTYLTFIMSLQEAVMGLVTDVLEAVLLLFKTSLYVLWAMYRLIVPAEERSVGRDIVLVTGTGHGIGRELARQYGLLGAQVVCVDFNEELNRMTVKELHELEIKAHAYTCDVSNRDAVLKLAADVKRDVGFVTILVNNAGIMPCRPFLQQTPEEKLKMMGVNVFAHYWLLEAFLPAMLSNDYGHVVALSSAAGLMGTPNLVPYCASKFAVTGLMEGAIAEMKDLGKNIKFTTMYPIMVDTGLCKKPRLGRPSLLPMQEPKEVAARIISAQRRGHREVSAPFFIQFFQCLLRMFPDKAQDLILDSLETGVDAVN